MLACALGARLLPDTTALSVVPKIVFPGVALGVLPGMLALLLALPARRFGILELVGLGGVITFGIGEVLTAVAVLAGRLPRRRAGMGGLPGA